MNSIGNILNGFTWTYKGTISTMKTKGYQGGGSTRTLFLKPATLEEIPEVLFAVKVSQSQKPEMAGKTVFKYLSLKLGDDQKYTTMAPEGITTATPLAEVKSTIIAKLQAFVNSGLELSINVRLHGKFTNVRCSDGVYAIYDEEKFVDADPLKNGMAPYYVKSDAVMEVTLKGANSAQGNEYLQSEIKTALSSNDVFQKRAVGQVWGEDAGTENAPVATEPAGSVW